MHALEDGKMHSLILLLIALLTFEPFAEANTEIINFGASYTENVTLVEAASWCVVFHSSSQTHITLSQAFPII